MIPFFISFIIPGATVSALALVPRHHFLKTFYGLLFFYCLITAYMLYFLSTQYNKCRFAKSILVGIAAGVVTGLFLSVVYLFIGLYSIRKSNYKRYKSVLEQTRDTEERLDPGLPRQKRWKKVRAYGGDESYWTDELKTLVSV
jgi:hypothetical protein